MSRHEEQNAAVRDQFSKQAPAYARLARSRSDAAFVRLIAALRPTKADRVLDVGCGPGLVSMSLAEHAAHVTGIDLTPEMLQQARSLQHELSIANVDWLQGDALPLPFADGAFSIILTKATFHHLADPAAVLAQMVRVCTPGGRIAVSDLTLEPTKMQAFDRIEKLRDPSHLRVLSADHLRGLGPAIGLLERDYWQTATSLPLEAVLATSYPDGPGVLEQVRALYRQDAVSGEDRYGLRAREEGGQIFVSYPMTTVVWESR